MDGLLGLLHDLGRLLLVGQLQHLKGVSHLAIVPREGCSCHKHCDVFLSALFIEAIPASVVHLSLGSVFIRLKHLETEWMTYGWCSATMWQVSFFRKIEATR